MLFVALAAQILNLQPIGPTPTPPAPQRIIGAGIGGGPEEIPYDPRFDQRRVVVTAASAMVICTAPSIKVSVMAKTPLTVVMAGDDEDDDG